MDRTIDDLSDGALIANYEKNKGSVVLESGTYYRNKSESPSKFIQSVRAAHYAWQDSQRSEEARTSELSKVYSGGGAPTKSADNPERVSSPVQESEVDMEAAIQSQVNAARSRLLVAESQLKDANEIVDLLEAKINRLQRAVINGEQFLEKLKANNVPPETTS